MTDRKTYGQFCALARALDVIGDRWTLLVVRELLVGARTFRELEDGLAGISPSLLTARLTALVAAGLVARNAAPPRSRSVTYTLTEDGADLEPAVLELIRWGARRMGSGPGEDRVDPRWGVLALRALLEGPAPALPDAVVRVESGGPPVSVTVANGRRRVEADAPGSPTATVRGPLPLLLGLAAGFSVDTSALEVDGPRRRTLAALTLV